MIWFSTTFGFLFGNSIIVILGGEFWAYLHQLAEQALGKIGTGILLLFILFSFLIIAYNFSFGFLKAIPLFKKKDKDKSQNFNQPKEDLYNTAEFSVDEEDSVIYKENDLKNDTSDLNNGNLLDEPMIVIEPGVEKEEQELQKNKDSNPDIEITIEKPSEDQTLAIQEENGNEMEHKTIDEPYDPWLDFPHYKFPELSLLEKYGSDQITVQKEELE